MKTVNGSEMQILPRHLTEDELIGEALNSDDPLVRRLAERLDELYRPLEDAMYAVGYDNEPRMILKDYENAEMNLSDFLQTKWWNAWDADNRNELHLHDPDRANRCDEAAEDGSDGSTHCERLEDMRGALQSHGAADTFGQLTVQRLLIEVESTFYWFEARGELDEQGC